MLESQDTLISQAPVPDLRSLAADFAVLKLTLESEVDNNDMLKRKIKSFVLINDEAQDRIRTLELSLDHLDQYGRRQNIEMAGIPHNIPKNTLESTLFDILGGISVKVSSYEIVACHRLKGHGSRRNAIVRFTNRKVPL